MTSALPETLPTSPPCWAKRSWRSSWTSPVRSCRASPSSCTSWLSLFRGSADRLQKPKEDRLSVCCFLCSKRWRCLYTSVASVLERCFSMCLAQTSNTMYIYILNSSRKCSISDHSCLPSHPSLPSVSSSVNSTTKGSSILASSVVPSSTTSSSSCRVKVYSSKGLLGHRKLPKPFKKNQKKLFLTPTFVHSKK